MREYPAGIKYIKKDSRTYVVVARNIKRDDGVMTTQTIKSFGLETIENIRLAEQLVKDLNAHLEEKNAPKLEINPAALRSLQQGPILGIISPEITPIVWRGLYAVVDHFVQQYLSPGNESDLKDAIRLTQPDLETEEEVERFYQWIKDRSLEDKARILIKRWHYR